MDLPATLRMYHNAYAAQATQHASYEIACEWVAGILPDLPMMSRTVLLAHAQRSAQWANAGYLPAEAFPLIASGMTPELASAMDPEPGQHTERLADQIRLLENDE